MKKLVCFVLASMLAVPAAFAQDRYISDKLFTYMHSGPSNQFRIIGSVDAGDKVKLLSTNKDSGYTQVQDSKGRKGWVESRFVTNQESMALRLPKLENELKDVKEKLANARSNADQEKAGLVDSLETRNRQINELEQGYSEMSQQLSASQEEVRKLRAKLDTQKDDLLLKYFMYGGGVAGIGLLLGLILPHIIPRRKRSPSGWA
ncbi:SH3 domain-containing protein [Vibrio brasiliensis]|uniref:SH3 domain-containing protein n=1 Tax=Vibrio brasiliensis LMG 20546 TaxID=945543 RepID=E8LNS4_9VIBR|nr:TIGR04211 family SH3 domain-containing protein [Vibrio brasiliensis]EGA67626.1 SH3 domain-containing protein [Vibrio brasiliensis LMG 20546]MCG9650112.1 SH3 domain-containing protein [Vibrio brasiliensis]MCG9726271.1 SH3 domain-containing protein [Vibrio brasiliensis]MCG9750609.1 SH3 domain-containing protein [Vibrio brasiliensis]MCG9780798.1 SH3 domain-containing protein [Vibrio brasiliensis]